MRRRSFACLVLGLALGLIHASGAWAADKTLDLRVLVISTGPASVDPGLDLMDDLLNEMGVPYDVLDSSTDVLTPGRLSSGDQGFYNGIILTNTELSLPGGAGSGFNFLEWQTLHDFERDFGVRESVLSGFPAFNPLFGLDYGLTDIVAGSSFTGDWEGPSGGTQIFEYVNEATPLPITDFAYAGRPFVVYAGEPRTPGVGPHVEPYLVDAADPDKVFVSRLLYDDGREVLLSTIANASFLVHSQVLAYEFVNFATKGVFIGSREIYLETHVDDLFLQTELWDPAANAVDPNNGHRLSAAELTNAAAAQTALRDDFPIASEYTIDFPFNGAGAVPTYDTIPDAVLAPTTDAFVRSKYSTTNYGNWNTGEVRLKSGDNANTLLGFTLTELPETAIDTVTLTMLTTGRNEINAEVCRVTASWSETKATWQKRDSSSSWATAGGSYDPASCVPFKMRDWKYVTADVTPIVLDWQSGAAPNYGLIVIPKSTGNGTIILHSWWSKKRPTLRISFQPILVGDPDVPAVADTSPPTNLLHSIADTTVKQKYSSDNFGTKRDGDVRSKSGDNANTLIRFDVSKLPTRPADKATLKLWTEGSNEIYADVCRVTAAWDEGRSRRSKDATWSKRQTGVSWATAGGDYSSSTCVNFRLKNKAHVSVDITAIVNSWINKSAPNHGLIVIPKSSGSGTVGLRESSSSKRPTLTLGFPTLTSVADTFVRQNESSSNFGTRSTAEIYSKSNNNERAFVRFDVSGLPQKAPERAVLTVWTQDTNEPYADICRATTPWSESKATWQKAESSTSWTTAGGDWDPASCISFKVRSSKFVAIDVTPIVTSWLTGAAPNYGFAFVATTSSGYGEIATRDASSSYRPGLQVKYTQGTFDPLTTEVIRNRNKFRFLNHTYTHADLDAGSASTYESIFDEIEQNQAIWTALGLPERAENDPIVVTGEHSGLNDRRGNDDPSDDVLYPAGFNPLLGQAAQALGVRYLASDASHPSQAFEQFVPGHDILLLPRYPTAVFYNASTPAENTDEYNYVFHERFVNAGQDPCTIPGAICTPRTYEQILAAEADTTVRHMLSGKLWPHFFHQSNLRDYDGTGSTLLFDWLNAVLDRYDDVMTLPVRTLPFYEIAEISEQRLAARAANVRGQINLTTGEVTLVADSQATVPVTGIADGEVYGGQYIQRIDVDAIPQSFTADRLLGQ